MDKIDEERKLEIADTNERLGKANETIIQNKAVINTRIDQVQENSRIQIEGIQKKQETLVNLQKQTGERCDHINTTVNNLTGQVCQNQEEIELIRTRPVSYTHLDVYKSQTYICLFIKSASEM